MSDTKLYTIIYVVLFVFATVQVAVEFAGVLEPETYMIGLTAIMILSLIKAVLVAGYYQHLRFEPRGLTYLMLGGLAGVIALTTAAAYSIT
ncbi:hypothetical protein BRD00_15140 [Halobacteriales archaeon QS_8_69_26]|nr:MAG: hypothetical protein BRD00_15140 [Halobacteriales archaeon QS_8_69_26]